MQACIGKRIRLLLAALSDLPHLETNQMSNYNKIKPVNFDIMERFSAMNLNKLQLSPAMQPHLKDMMSRRSQMSKLLSLGFHSHKIQKQDTAVMDI